MVNWAALAIIQALREGTVDPQLVAVWLAGDRELVDALPLALLKEDDHVIQNAQEGVNTFCQSHGLTPPPNLQREIDMLRHASPTKRARMA
jgi:hypothetical protein